MKTSIEWLRDFVAVDMPAGELAESLSLAGLEVDSVTAVAPAFDGVVVAEILEKKPHPDADRLSICRISDGQRELAIVCGAPNAAAGLRVPFAPGGTVLPGNLKIRAAKIRGVPSEGMLCSARELGLADDSAGLLILDRDAPIGCDLRRHLRLDDHILDIDLTPNRGDCFSVLGIAREIAALQEQGPLDEALTCIDPAIDDTFDVELQDTGACPRFAGRVIRGLATNARSPDWLRERLRRAGLRAIHPVVDVTNYVMLEFGQPLHAYRLDRLAGGISVRLARAGEKLTLLDETEVSLTESTLVITDQSGPIGLAGIMGGLSTAVDAGTDAIFLESAFFAPAAMQGRARHYGLHTDASIRFERGVDPSGQERAVERATSLLLEIAGGEAGPLVLAEDETQVPSRPTIRLRGARIRQVLGIELGQEQIEQALSRLGMQIEPEVNGWQVTAPSYRFDIAIEEDLIEELARMVGYDRIPVTPGTSQVKLARLSESDVSADTVSDLLAARGYREVVSFSFAERSEQARITGRDDAIALANPISRELDVLRRSLWPGLLRTAVLNQSHQIDRCRLFEVGTVFSAGEDSAHESTCVAGLLTGPVQGAHWEGATADADFFDLKADVDAVLALWLKRTGFRYEAATHPALNPGRSAAIYREDARIGWLGELHPQLQQHYEFRHPVILFELDLAAAGKATIPKYQPFTKFPFVRRDLAVVVDERISVAQLTEHVAASLGTALRQCEVFDIYRGPGVDSGRKSVGMGLILQDASRTLNDQETDDMMRRVMRHLEQELEATIRS